MDPQNGTTVVQILKIKELHNGDGNEDFEYTISVGGQERTYADRLTQINTENEDPSAPPLVSREHGENQSLYPTPSSQPRVVYML
jgi:hypothetical protein